MERCPPEWIAFAAELADVAGEIVRPHFRRPVAIETKSNQSPVTAVDRAVERSLRERIGERFPEHGVRGEEFEDKEPDAELCWVLDPIDGTRSFIAGKPTFGTLIALAYRGQPILGIIDQPISHERWIGAEGHPTTLGGEPVRTRELDTLEGAQLSTTAPHFFFDPADRRAFEALAENTDRPVFGMDCYAYGLLALGSLDLVVEAGLAVHDHAALGPVVRGAGGALTDWKGEPLGLRDGARVLAAGSAAVHRAAMDVLAGER